MLSTLSSVAWIYPVIIVSGVLIAWFGVFRLTIIIAESQIHVFDHASTRQVVLMIFHHVPAAPLHARGALVGGEHRAGGDHRGPGARSAATS